jgi:hypothetical protein
MRMSFKVSVAEKTVGMKKKKPVNQRNINLSFFDTSKAQDLKDKSNTPREKKEKTSI